MPAAHAGTACAAGQLRYDPVVENPSVARVLNEIADLLELKGENIFRVRAYRTGAQVVADSPARVADLDAPALLAIDGIGKDLAARIRDIATTGTTGLRDELLQVFPATILEVMRLQGIGPKTVALLYHTLNIRSLDELEAAAKAGAIRGIKGMGAKKEALILTAIAERRRHAGRHLIGHACETAETLVAWLRQAEPDATYDIVGSLRRGAETSGDIDILATGAPADLLQHFTRFQQMERVLGLGDTKASILLTNQMQADLRLVPAESRGAALQYFTGSKAHNIQLRQRALSRGYTLNEYALADAATGARIAGETEDGIYAALGLPCIDPTLREARGEIDAAEAGTLPRLVTLDDLRGDVHMHTTASDGRHDIETMAIAARDAGRSYICITDHSQSLAMANGLDDARALAHAARIREANARIDGITILAGIEVDILADGRLDLEESTLAALDFVVASVHSAFDQTAEAMTVRVLTAMACPFVDAIGHPTGRKILRREPHRIDIEALIEAAGLYGIALEINSNYHRLDLSDVHARRAKAQGVGLLIDSDAHSTTELGLLRWGVLTARRAWLEPADVWNTRDVDAFRNGLRRHRRPTAAKTGRAR
jgi:DNA polymerase (family 10)